jgi:hypothetical protein
LCYDDCMEGSQIENAGVFCAEGFLAWGDAVLRTDNPYEPGSCSAESWFVGWDAAQVENTTRAGVARDSHH